MMMPVAASSPCTLLCDSIRAGDSDSVVCLLSKYEDELGDLLIDSVSDSTSLPLAPLALASSYVASLLPVGGVKLKRHEKIVELLLDRIQRLESSYDKETVLNARLDNGTGLSAIMYLIGCRDNTTSSSSSEEENDTRQNNVDLTGKPHFSLLQKILAFSEVDLSIQKKEDKETVLHLSIMAERLFAIERCKKKEVQLITDDEKESDSETIIEPLKLFNMLLDSGNTDLSSTNEVKQPSAKTSFRKQATQVLTNFVKKKTNTLSRPTTQRMSQMSSSSTARAGGAGGGLLSSKDRKSDIVSQSNKSLSTIISTTSTGTTTTSAADGSFGSSLSSVSLQEEGTTCLRIRSLTKALNTPDIDGNIPLTLAIRQRAVLISVSQKSTDDNNGSENDEENAVIDTLEKIIHRLCCSSNPGSPPPDFDPNIPNLEGNPSLSVAVVHGGVGREKIVSWVLQHPRVDIDCAGYGGLTPFFSALQLGNRAVVQNFVNLFEERRINSSGKNTTTLTSASVPSIASIAKIRSRKTTKGKEDIAIKSAFIEVSEAQVQLACKRLEERKKQQGDNLDFRSGTFLRDLIRNPPYH